MNKILTKRVESSGQNKGQFVPKMSFLTQNDSILAFGKKSPIGCQKV